MDDALLPNVTQFLSQVDPFDKLPKKVIRDLSHNIKITYLTQGEIIDPLHDQDEKYLYIIRSGAMEQRKNNGVLRARLEAEDLFGFTFLDSELDDNQGYRAIALENCLLYLIPHSALQHLFKTNPEYAEHFASQAQVRLNSALDVVWSNREKGLFIRKVREVASTRIAVVTADMSIQAVAHEMRAVKRTSCAVIYENNLLVGLITDRDMTMRVIAEAYPIDKPVKDIMTPNPLTVGPDDLVLHAASLMMQYNVRDLPVVENNRVVGLLTTTHLVQNHRMQAIFLIEKIKYAESITELVELNAERQAIFEALVEGKVIPETIGKVMAMIFDAYTRRFIEMAIDEYGEPPCDFAWIVAGSHARNEVHSLTDQDNALVLSDEASAEDKLYFKKMAIFVTQGLDQCDYPLCTGHYMATTDKWCQPLHVWQAYYKKWCANPEYERLLNISVFLEVRTAYGNKTYEQILHQCMHEQIKSNHEFLTILVKDATNTNPPLGIFNSLVLEKSGENKKTLDIKKYAINLIIDLARIYALAVGSDALHTEARFLAAKEAGVLSEDAFKNMMGAYRFILSFRYGQQLKALKEGKTPNNHINPDTFGSFERKHLKDAFRIIADQQEAAKIRFGKH